MVGFGQDGRVQNLYYKKLKAQRYFGNGTVVSINLKDGHDDGDGSAHNCNRLCPGALEGLKS